VGIPRLQPWEDVKQILTLLAVLPLVAVGMYLGVMKTAHQNSLTS
jgi:hypothetical protein